MRNKTREPHKYCDSRILPLAQTEGFEPSVSECWRIPRSALYQGPPDLERPLRCFATHPKQTYIIDISRKTGLKSGLTQHGTEGIRTLDLCVANQVMIFPVRTEMSSPRLFTAFSVLPEF